MIDAEEPAAILSDDTLVERLRGDGIDIARRTVAKYREAMRIPSSVQRRRDKQSMLGNALTATASSIDKSATQLRLDGLGWFGDPEGRV